MLPSRPLLRVGYLPANRHSTGFGCLLLSRLISLSPPHSRGGKIPMTLEPRQVDKGPLIECGPELEAVPLFHQYGPSTPTARLQKRDAKTFGKGVYAKTGSLPRHFSLALIEAIYPIRVHLPTPSVLEQCCSRHQTAEESAHFEREFLLNSSRTLFS